jgi:hypothetical protein
MAQAKREPGQLVEVQINNGINEERQACPVYVHSQMVMERREEESSEEVPRERIERTGVRTLFQTFKRSFVRKWVLTLFIFAIAIQRHSRPSLY